MAERDSRTSCHSARAATIRAASARYLFVLVIGTPDPRFKATRHLGLQQLAACPRQRGCHGLTGENDLPVAGTSPQDLPPDAFRLAGPDPMPSQRLSIRRVKRMHAARSRSATSPSGGCVALSVLPQRPTLVDFLATRSTTIVQPSYGRVVVLQTLVNHLYPSLNRMTRSPSCHRCSGAP